MRYGRYLVTHPHRVLGCLGGNTPEEALESASTSAGNCALRIRRGALAAGAPVPALGRQCRRELWGRDIPFAKYPVVLSY